MFAVEVSNFGHATTPAHSERACIINDNSLIDSVGGLA